MPGQAGPGLPVPPVPSCSPAPQPGQQPPSPWAAPALGTSCNFSGSGSKTLLRCLTPEPGGSCWHVPRGEVGSRSCIPHPWGMGKACVHGDTGQCHIPAASWSSTGGGMEPHCATVLTVPWWWCFGSCVQSSQQSCAPMAPCQHGGSTDAPGAPWQAPVSPTFGKGPCQPPQWLGALCMAVSWGCWRSHHPYHTGQEATAELAWGSRSMAVPAWGSWSTAVLFGAGLILGRSRIRPFFTGQELGWGVGRGYPPGLSSGVARHCAAGPRCRWTLVQAGMQAVIWSATEFWEHLLSWIITCPVSCIPSTPPN